jgi:mycobactin polyketide synthetase MbtD
VLISADTPRLLRDEAAALLSYLQDHPRIPPDHVAATLFRTRAVRCHRALAMVTTCDELVDALQSVIDGREHRAVVRSGAPAAARRLAYVLPGQGSQRPGMGELFYQHMPAYRAEADRCDGIFRELFGQSPLGYLLGHADTDDSTVTVQSALFIQMAGLGAMWRAAGIEPDAVVGHSQGEIAAAYLSGKVTLHDAVAIVGTRSRAVETISSDTYAMGVVTANRDECESLLARQSGWAQVSVVNSSRMVGISGDRATIDDLVQTLGAGGRFARVIPVRYPAHTAMVNEFRDLISEAVQHRLQNSHFLDSDIDCIGATLGDSITSDLPADKYWFWNLRNTVRFDQAIATACARGVDTFVELAEQPTLQLAVQDNLDVLGANSAVMTGTSLRSATDLSEFTRNLAILAVNDAAYRWELLRQDSDGAPPLPLLDFPNTQMNEIHLWLPYQGAPSVPTDLETTRSSAKPVAAQGELPQLLVEDWIRLAKRSMLPPRSIGIVDHTGRCAQLVAALCAHAENQGVPARPIESGADAGELDTVVALLPAMPPLDLRSATAEIAEFFVSRRWWCKPSPTVTNYWLVTVGGESVVPDDLPPHPVHAAISAGFRCIGGEQPDIGFRHLDLALGETPADAARAILTALHTAGESEMALREGNIHVKRLIEANGHPSDPAVRIGDHVVIAGGTGRLGLEFCEYAAQVGARRITLMSRSGETGSITERLRQMAARHPCVDIRIMACDVSDDAAVARAADEIRDTPIDLLLHAVMDGISATEIELTEITAQLVDQIFGGKVVGIANLVDSLALDDDCRIVLCSSLAATLGGRGKSMYAAANRMLDGYAQYLRAKGRNCVSVQWGQWAVYRGHNDADIANLAAVGYRPMRSADAVALGLSGLRGNAVIAAFDWDRARNVFGLLGYGSTLSQLTTLPPQQKASGALDVRQHLVRLLADVMGAEDLEGLDSARPLVAIGLDSLHALQFRRRVIGVFGIDVPVAELMRGASLDDVVLAVDGGPAPAARQVAVPPARREVSEPVKKLGSAGNGVAGELEPHRMQSARRDMDLFGLSAMWAVLAPVLGGGDVRTVDEIASRLHLADRHMWVLRQWLSELVKHGCLEQHPDHGYRQAGPVPSPTRADLATVCRDLGYLPAFAEFLSASNTHLADLVQDQVSVQELLFPDGSTITADAVYRDNVISRYLNLAAGKAVAETVERLVSDRSPVRVLELGAGIGGMTHDIVAGLAHLPVDYRFTDVSTFFLNAAQNHFADHPWMQFEIVDLNADLRQQPPQDIVVASNVVHNAHDVGRTLREIHDLLRPGGAIIFIEVCRAHCQFMTSVYFLMSPRPGQPQVGLTDVRAGTDRIFLTQSEWRDQLVECGFTPALVLPSADDPLSALDQHIFVAVREADKLGAPS